MNIRDSAFIIYAVKRIMDVSHVEKGIIDNQLDIMDIYRRAIHLEAIDRRFQPDPKAIVIRKAKWLLRQILSCYGFSNNKNIYRAISLHIKRDAYHSKQQQCIRDLNKGFWEYNEVFLNMLAVMQG